MRVFSNWAILIFLVATFWVTWILFADEVQVFDFNVFVVFIYLPIIMSYLAIVMQLFAVFWVDIVLEISLSPFEDNLVFGWFESFCKFASAYIDIEIKFVNNIAIWFDFSYDIISLFIFLNGDKPIDLIDKSW
jgi:hypothetical protein